MMLIMGQSNRIWHHWSGKHPGSVGVLIGPSYKKKVPIDSWMPFVLDNDAFTCWRDNKPWDVEVWRQMLSWVKSTGLAPLWAAVPDVVADREATIRNWGIYAHEIKELGWPAAFCVQDGMTPDDVPLGADVIFVGGTDEFKWGTLKMWCDNFRRVHCARVNPIRKIELCELLGCESVDGTGWFMDPSRQDKVPALKAFVQGVRVFSREELMNDVKKKHAPRRYTSAAEIEKDIARVHRKIKKLEKKAQEELESESLYRGVDVAACRKHGDAATELLGKIKRLKETRLKRLGNTLSNFQTIPLGLDGVGEDVILNRVE